MPGRVGAVVEERKALREGRAALRAQLAPMLVSAAAREHVRGVIVRRVSVDDAPLLPGALADVSGGEVRAVLAPGGRCGVGSGHPAVPAGALLIAALKVTGGKEGGRPELAQGMTARPEDYLEAVRASLATLLG